MKRLAIQWDILSTTAISILIHALVLLLLLAWHVSTKIELPEFVEVQFISGESRSVAPPTQAQPRPQEESQAEVVPAPVRKEIRLPKRRMSETEPPELQVRSAAKKAPARKRIPTAPVRRDQTLQKPEFVPESGGLRENLPLPEISAERQTIDTKESAKRGFVQAFEIEGKAAERIILEKVLPEYPEGYAREGTVKIRFTILPNGRVGEVIPILKTDAVLEQNAMAVLAKWRFNPLPREAPQDTVVGIITFRYKLK